MSCSPRDLLNAASLIYEHERSEGMSRAAASRAYYAAYHAAKDYHQRLPAPGSVMNARGMHERLYTQLRYPTVQDVKTKSESQAVGNMLMAICAQRVNADYKLEEAFSEIQAREAIYKSTEILKVTGT